MQNNNDINDDHNDDFLQKVVAGGVVCDFKLGFPANGDYDNDNNDDNDVNNECINYDNDNNIDN